jgi:hypothetical protein
MFGHVDALAAETDAFKLQAQALLVASYLSLISPPAPTCP